MLTEKYLIVKIHSRMSFNKINFSYFFHKLWTNTCTINYSKTIILTRKMK